MIRCFDSFEIRQILLEMVSLTRTRNGKLGSLDSPLCSSNLSKVPDDVMMFVRSRDKVIEISFEGSLLEGSR